MFDREKAAVYSKGPRGVFFEKLDHFDPNRAENEWGRVEHKMPAVYTALAAGTGLTDPDIVQTLRELVAVH